MSLFFRNWLDEGYYEEDSSGDLTRLEDPKDIRNAKKKMAHCIIMMVLVLVKLLMMNY